MKSGRCQAVEGILGFLKIARCWIFLLHLLHGDVIEFFLFIIWTGESLNGDALLFDAGFGVGDFGGASPKILLRNGISTQVLYIQDRIGRDVENQIGCRCRRIFLELQEWLNVKGQHGIEELRNQKGKCSCVKFCGCPGSPISKALPTPAKAKMSGPCCVVCEPLALFCNMV